MNMNAKQRRKMLKSNIIYVKKEQQEGLGLFCNGVLRSRIGRGQDRLEQPRDLRL
jgi:hypothetical protein